MCSLSMFEPSSSMTSANSSSVCARSDSVASRRCPALLYKVMPSTTRGFTSVMAHLDQPFDARLQTSDLLAGAETSTPLAPFLGGPFLACCTDDRFAFAVLALAVSRPRAEYLFFLCTIDALAVLARDVYGIHQQPSADGLVRYRSRRSPHELRLTERRYSRRLPRHAVVYTH